MPNTKEEWGVSVFVVAVIPQCNCSHPQRFGVGVVNPAKPQCGCQTLAVTESSIVPQAPTWRFDILAPGKTAAELGR